MGWKIDGRGQVRLGGFVSLIGKYIALGIQEKPFSEFPHINQDRARLSIKEIQIALCSTGSGFKVVWDVKFSQPFRMCGSCLSMEPIGL